MRLISFVLLLLAACSLPGCGKTLGALKQTVCSAADIPVQASEDTKDNANTVKGAVTP